MKRNQLIVVVLCFISNVGFANDLGNYGTVFPIAEDDIRAVIQAKLHAMEASGELAQRQREVTARVSEHIIRPKPLNLSTTTSPNRFQVDQTVLVNQDIYLPSGALVAKAGTRLNPFDALHFSKTLFFFNGDDKQQVAWVKHHYQEYKYVKFILTGGDIRDAAEQFGRIYFDLDGRLSTLFQLKHVPSVVFEDKRQWAIQEIGVSDV